jgi:hypothetical protein
MELDGVLCAPEFRRDLLVGHPLNRELYYFAFTLGQAAGGPRYSGAKDFRAADANGTSEDLQVGLRPGTTALSPLS